MSGTILDHKWYMENLGIDPANAVFRSWGSSFPVENRPIHYEPVGKMTYPCLRPCRSNACCRKQTLPRMVKRVANILGEYPEVKGVIHTQSYEINDVIVRGLIDAGVMSRVLTHDPQNRSLIEELHRIRKDEPTVLGIPWYV